MVNEVARMIFLASHSLDRAADAADNPELSRDVEQAQVALGVMLAQHCANERESRK